ncbi:MAG: BtpA/SgcQ family protein [Sphaerochaetaceae bacterium]
MKMKEIFKVEKPMIGMVHLPALPGSPLYDETKGIKFIQETVNTDVKTLIDAGFDALSFSNEGDRPYLSNVDKSTVATMARVIALATEKVRIPFGLSVLADSDAAIAIGNAVGANFVRIFLSWVFVGDWGIVDPCAGALLRGKRNINGTMKTIANISGHTAPLGNRSLKDIAAGAVKFGLADALCLGGTTAGAPIDIEDIKAARAGSCGEPVIAGTGVSINNMNTYLPIVDGVIVGTSLKYDKDTFKPVNPESAKAFIRKANEVRNSL